MNAKLCKVLRALCRRNKWSKAQYQETKRVLSSMSAQGRAEGKALIMGVLDGNIDPEALKKAAEG